MKLFLTVTTYVVNAIASILAFFSLTSIYQDLSGNDDSFFALEIILISPIAVIISFIICYFLIKKITVKPILFGTILGFWLIKVIQLVHDVYNVYQYKTNEDYITNVFIRNLVDYYILLTPILFVILSHFLLKRYNNWLHISSFTCAATIGFFTSYATVLFIRFTQNSFTSYFYFDRNELMIVIIGTAVFTVLGNSFGLKRCNNRTSHT